MRTFVIVMFIFFLLETGIKLHQTTNKHPRDKSFTFVDDFINFFVFMGISVWAGYLLF